MSEAGTRSGVAVGRGWGGRRCPWSLSLLGLAGLDLYLPVCSGLSRHGGRGWVWEGKSKLGCGCRRRGQLVCLPPQVMVPFVILLAVVPTAPVAYVVAFVSGMSIAVSLLLPW